MSPTKAILALLGAAHSMDLVSASSCTERTVQVGDISVRISTGGPTAFRLRIIPAGGSNVPNPMPDASLPDAPCQHITDGQSQGVSSDFGSLTVSPSGVVVLKDASGKTLTTSQPITGDTQLLLSSADGKLYGRGASPLDMLQLSATTSKPKTYNRATFTPYYYSLGDGYGALGAVAVDKNTGSEMDLTYTTSGKQVEWKHGPGSFELHLIPAPTLAEGTQRYYQLLGQALILPKYAFGFGASRWGWESRDYVEEQIQKFRDGKYPIDYIILDFEWFMHETDYAYNPEGKPYYTDFGYNPKLFDEPAAQLATYQNDFHIRFGGIRKPRIGNSGMLTDLRAKGWILPNGEPAGTYPPEGHYADERCIDFAIPEARDWYAKKMEHYTEDGVDLWWNDEGEPNYYTFWFWNVAERKGVAAKAPTKRFFSLNRAWSPGMARLGAAVWTGDVSATWEDLKGTPGMMLNWVLGGAPYVGCDIGGFNGQTNGKHLTRWLQIGAFMPIMRVHSVIDATPHFPWLFGDDAARAMRRAIELRYRLVPYHYSLAHRLYRTGKHWIRPLVMEFPDEPEVAEITTEWMDGDILCAPVVREDDTREITLPKGKWYMLGATPEITRTLIVNGGQQFGGKAEAAEVPAFVRPGAVVPLAAVGQHTQELTGKPLEVQIYTGADGSFTLYEDDDETTDYMSDKVRSTSMTWSDASRTFKWTVTSASGLDTAKCYKQLQLTIFDGSSGGIVRTDPQDIGTHGSIKVGTYGNIIME
eukprot:CAMPEP_0176048522 /NCGR_PEP_ID=MMETSP0120_2-20121206/24104_1 /TAXON_ID=160619 /ORGANISM="Kryptoperidinium foliaceum, Strain CCMP 1326" /LENGTH=755 /DNA_ID=CAMNT_0017381941 /DNA_START=84 /DNA_END=2351 /DNA_ORIENTATION=+